MLISSALNVLILTFLDSRHSKRNVNFTGDEPPISAAAQVGRDKIKMHANVSLLLRIIESIQVCICIYSHHIIFPISEKSLNSLRSEA